MVDVSKIGANGIDYNVKDAEARSGLATANANISSLTTDLETAEGNITSLGTRMTSAEGDITSLQSQINSLVTGGTGYVKLPDGTMIQWGTATVAMPAMTQIASSGVYYAAVELTFPLAFINTSYTVNGNSRYSTGYFVPFGASANTAAKATVHVYDYYARAAGNIVLRYTAVGRWS